MRLSFSLRKHLPLIVKILEPLILPEKQGNGIILLGNLDKPNSLQKQKNVY